MVVREKAVRNCSLFLLSVILLSAASCSKDTREGYPIEPVPFTSVHLTDQFWAPKLEINQEVTIPIAIEQSTITGRIKNFEIAGGLESGSFCSEYPFDDSDIYKIIEAASYSLQNHPDPALEARIDTLIYKIGLAQEPDGYLYTYRTIMGDDTHPWVGKRWEKVHELSHELYNLGHLYEAAVAHYKATGKRELLDIALKSANMVDSTFGWGKREDYPGHQEIEIGLVKLYGVTGEKKYLDLAKFFLDVRGPNGDEYNQAHKKVVDQREGVGHSVRATYMYAAMADIAAITRDESYIEAIRGIWEDIVYKKTYLTGGIGASGGNEGFSTPYLLPNMSAYCETCASVGNMIWNYRMFLSDGDAKYVDLFEKTLYNAFLSGVSLSGDRFFYPNPLESFGQHQRGKWFGCACCPPNVARTLPSIPGYIYATTDKDLYINMYAANEATFAFQGGEMKISQQTAYPWDGKIEVKIDPGQKKKFRLHLRIPGWARNSAIPGDLYHFTNQEENPVVITVNGKEVKAAEEKGYAVINRSWSAGDVLTLTLPMDIRKVEADEKVEADREKFAIQRGPMIYCAEWPEAADHHVLNLVFDENSSFSTHFEPALLNGVQVIEATAAPALRNNGGEVELEEKTALTLIPYHTWNNRGPGEMMVWLPFTTNSVRPLPAKTLSSTSTVSASVPTRALIALNDQYEPRNSGDQTWPYYHWWPEQKNREWVQYDFAQPSKISKMKVYWYDDGPFGGCRIPESYELQYLAGKKWLPVPNSSTPVISKDSWNILTFDPVLTSAVRLVVKLPDDNSAGIHEWVVE